MTTEKPFTNTSRPPTINYVKDAVLMKKLAKLAEVYLAWADCYENLWDDERKAREDERTNYGFYLKQMNLQVKDMLFSVFEDDLDDEIQSTDSARGYSESEALL